MSHLLLWPGTNEIKSQAYNKEAKELVGNKAIQETRSFVSRSTQMAGPRSLSRLESFTRQLALVFNGTRILLGILFVH